MADQLVLIGIGGYWIPVVAAQIHNWNYWEKISLKKKKAPWFVFTIPPEFRWACQHVGTPFLSRRGFRSRSQPVQILCVENWRKVRAKGETPHRSGLSEQNDVARTTLRRGGGANQASSASLPASLPEPKCIIFVKRR